MSNEVYKNIPVIPEKTKYWVIRAGIESKFFDDFSRDECIAIGWDRISNIENLKESNLGSIKKQVIAKYPELKDELKGGKLSRKISDISSKIDKFINELKIGDIIVTPGKKDVLIGEIISEPYLITDKYKGELIKDGFVGDLNKARKVKWVKRIERKDLEPNLKLILGVYHGIAHINEPQVITEINRSIYNFYISENEGHSIFKVKTQADIDFDKYAYFIKCLHDMYNLFKDDFGDQKLSIKTNIQSPGPIEIYGNVPLLTQVVLAVRGILKSDNSALSQLDEERQRMAFKYKEQNPPEHDYDDYDFPSHATY